MSIQDQRKRVNIGRPSEILLKKYERMRDSTAGQSRKFDQFAPLLNIGSTALLIPMFAARALNEEHRSARPSVSERYMANHVEAAVFG